MSAPPDPSFWTINSSKRTLSILIGGVIVLSLVFMYSTKNYGHVFPLQLQFPPPQIVPKNQSANKVTTDKCSMSSSLLERLHLSEQRWYEAVLLRHAFIEKKKGLNNFLPWGDVGFTTVWDLFAPSFDCPQGKKRVGNIGAGGKWVCGFEIFEKLNKTGAPCVVYSFGVETDSSFEALFLNRTTCHVFSYDMTVSKMGPEVANFYPNHPRQKFKKVGLGVNDTSKLRSLATLMKENGHTWIDVLKIDIEWAEWAVFEDLLKTHDVFPFGQLQVEIHLPRPFIFPKFYEMFEQLEAKGLRAFSAEINLDPCVRTPKSEPRFMEYSFLNVKTKHLLVPEGFSLKTLV